jgi:hypothetical protein
MKAGDIPRERWGRVLDEFSMNHEGWIVSLEVIGRSLGAQEAATGLPLVGISADGEGRSTSIELILGDRPEAHVSHTIDSPKRLRIRDDGQEGHEVVEVESEDGTMTLLRFSHVDQADHLLSSGRASKNA